MFKSILIWGSVLGAGALLGVALAVFSPFTRAPSAGQEASLPLRAGAVGPSAETPTAPAPVATAQRHNPVTTAALTQQSTIARLRRQLEEESAARQRLADEVNELRDTLQMLEQRLDGLTEHSQENDVPPPRAGGSRQIDVATLIAAGFDQNEAAFLTDRWGQQQMERLYLRDQAIREGWIDTPRYTQALRELNRGEASMRADIGPAAYDRFLFATGQPNRVRINTIIDSSPAQVSGLQPGDTIVTYDGNPIYSMSDLRAVTTTGEPDAPVVMEVDRGGQLVEIEIARGPLGVTLNSTRVEP